MNFQSETISDVAVKATLPLGISSMNLFGISLPDWVQILTAIYVALLAVDKLYIIYLRREARKRRIEHEPKE